MKTIHRVLKIAGWRPLWLPFCLVFLAGCTLQPPLIPTAVFNHQTDDLAEVAKIALEQAEIHGTARVLVVFDIDNTLLAMEQDLGSDQWFDAVTHGLGDSEHDRACFAQALGDQGALYFASAMRPTQPDAAAQVARLQSAGLNVIALTSRGPEFRLQTFRELRRNGISFWPGALPPQRGYPDAFVPESGKRPVRYEDGVFLTAGQDKGQMLEDLMKMTGTTHPRVIVMADDKPKNLAQVAQVFRDLSFTVHLFRYTREDPRVAAFDGEEADRQWRDLVSSLEQIQATLGPDNFAVKAGSDRLDCPRPE